ASTIPKSLNSVRLLYAMRVPPTAGLIAAAGRRGHLLQAHLSAGQRFNVLVIALQVLWSSRILPFAASGANGFFAGTCCRRRFAAQNEVVPEGTRSRVEKAARGAG